MQISDWLSLADATRRIMRVPKGENAQQRALVSLCIWSSCYSPAKVRLRHIVPQVQMAGE